MRRRAQPTETPQKAAPAIRPISVRVPVAVQMTGISRSKLYELIKEGAVQIVKVGASTLIPIESLQRFIDENKH